MTHELGPEARALLDAAREGLGPDAAAIRRMRAKIDASIASGAAGSGAGSGAGTAAGSGAGTAAGSGAGTGALAMKLGALALVAAVAVGAFVYSRGGEQASAPPAARVEAPATAPAASAAPATALEATVAPATALAASAAPAARAADAEPEIEMPVEVRAAPAKQPAQPPPPSRQQPAQPAQQSSSSPQPPASAARRADLAREVELVDRAMAALRRGAPGDALAAVRVHAAETAGAGQLAEDAAAIEIEALCRLHDAAVAAKLAAFDARWPQSAQRSRLTARCP